MKIRRVILILFFFLFPAYLYANSFTTTVKAKSKSIAKGAGDFTQYMLGFPFTITWRALQKVDISG